MTTTIKTTKFYIIEKNYVGPNKDHHVDADKIEISTSPAVTNLSREERTEGWCGTTNDWAVYAHGEYTTIDDARAAITKEFGEVRGGDNEGNRFESEDEDVVETYRPGKYAPMSSQAAQELAYEIQLNIDGDTTDERIAELVAEFLDGYAPDSAEDFIREAQELRDELRDEMEDDA